jgi:surface antigen
MPNRGALRVHVPHGLRRIVPAVASAAFLAVVVLVAAAHAADDPRDLLVIMPALNETLESERSGRDITWTNVTTGRAGTIRVERTFYRGQQPCRDYIRTTAGNGPSFEVRGVGCRVGKLNWAVEERRIEEPPATAAAPAPPPPEPTSRDAAARSGEPSGEPASPRAPRKAAPSPPPLRYGLPTRSQL